MQPSDILGLDVGEKRTGIARASTIAKLAEPLIIVETSKTLEAVKDLASKVKIDAVVVGLPRNLSGEDTPQTEWVREWVKLAKAEVGLPFYWQDESLTTKLAETRQPNNSHSDAEAASIILQDFLDSPATGRVMA